MQVLNFFSLFQSALRRLQREVEEATSDQSDLQEKIEEMKSSAYACLFFNVFPMFLFPIAFSQNSRITDRR